MSKWFGWGPIEQPGTPLVETSDPQTDIHVL
jgi:hypothetical protein